MRGTVDKTVDTVSVFFLCFIIFNGELPVHFVAGFQMSFFFTQCKIFVFRCKSTFPKYCGHYGPWSLVLATWQSAGLPYMGPDAMGAGFESVPSFFFKEIGVTRHSKFFFFFAHVIHAQYSSIDENGCEWCTCDKCGQSMQVCWKEVPLVQLLLAVQPSWPCRLTFVKVIGRLF